MPTKKVNKVGRPRLPHGDALGSPTPIRFSKIEKTAFEKLAKKEGLTLSRWVRKTLNKFIER
jgi:hypothetical protein